MGAQDSPPPAHKPESNPSADVSEQAPVRLAARLLLAARAWLAGGWSAVRAVEPDFWHNLGRELSAGRQWMDRAVVLAYAAATGLLVVGFTLLAEASSQAFGELQRWGAYGRYLPLLWTPALTLAVLWWTRRFVPGAMGSGIPQVVRALEDDLGADQVSWLVPLRLSLQKIGLISGGLLAGLSIDERGRPCRSAPASWLTRAAGFLLRPASTPTT